MKKRRGIKRKMISISESIDAHPFVESVEFRTGLWKWGRVGRGCLGLYTILEDVGNDDDGVGSDCVAPS